MRRTSILALSLMAAVLTACPSAPVDPDGTATSPKVPSVPTDFEVDDSIDGSKDKVDFKTLTARKAGKAKVLVTFPENHKVAGTVGILEKDATSNVEAKIVTEGEHEYALAFDVEAGAEYFLKVSSTKGASAYKIYFSIAAPTVADPCAGIECNDEQECKDGKCVDIPEPVCEPACRGGLVCVNGACEKPCGGGCPKGQLCSKRSNECYKDPCYQKTCGAGEKCVGGVCKAPPAPTPKTCNPACAGGATCNTTTGKCEGGGETPPPDNCAGPLNGSLVQVLPQGTKSVLVINRGSKVCVKVGQTGRVSGVDGVFKITEVYEFRSKAIIDKDSKTVPATGSVVINR